MHRIGTNAGFGRNYERGDLRVVDTPGAHHDDAIFSRGVDLAVD